MNHNSRMLAAGIAGLIASITTPGVHSMTFENEGIRGTFDSSLSTGVGVRLRAPNCGLVMAGASGDGAPQGCLAPTASLGDQGNLNYGRGDVFTGYLKGNHELVLKMPEEFTAMARVNWLRDFAATNTTGLQSVMVPLAGPNNDGLTDDARKDLRFKARVLDLWVSKSFSVGDQQARLRVGNQVINWGESLFVPGGINATNAFDSMRLSQPGVQLKEVMLPAPIVSLASGLGNGLNAEAYVQTSWNKTYIAPVGSYWSNTHTLGKGNSDYGFPETDARNGGQWGLSLRWQPRGSAANFGVYAMNYHDKVPVLKVDQATFAPSWVYPEDRKLFGLSANFPVGDWAVGTELSYRPKDAVSISPVAGCTSRDGRCWVDEKRWQWHLTGIYALTPANSRGFLDLVGASAANLLAEVVVVRYPKLQQSYDGDPVAPGYWGWGQETDPTAAPQSAGTRTSSGMVLDFSVTYDGTLIEGWQVVPEIYYFRALSGRTPNLTSMFMRGAWNTNLTVSFIRNPATWQFAINYTRFGGGSSPFDQTMRDRDFIGAVLTRNF